MKMGRYWPILRAIYLVFSLLRRSPAARWGSVPKVGVMFQKLGWCFKKLYQNPHPVLSRSGWWPCGSVGWCSKGCTRTLTIYGVVRGLVCGSSARWVGVPKSCTRTPTLYATILNRKTPNHYISRSFLRFGIMKIYYYVYFTLSELF